VRVIVLISNEGESDFYETPTEIIKEGIYQGIEEALSGKTIPLAQMWENREKTINIL